MSTEMTRRTSEHGERGDDLKFAYWVPNVSGGLVVSKIEQRTHWGYEYNKKLAVLAENSASSTRSARCVTWPATAPSTSTSRPASAWRCCWRPSD